MTVAERQYRIWRDSAYAKAWDRPPVVIVGAGPVGQRLAAEIARRTRDLPVVIFGEEPWEPYDRVRLSSWLAGDTRDVTTQEILSDSDRITCHFGTGIRMIDRELRLVVDDHGEACPYSRLILATGSRPVMPPLPGIDLAHVHTFRDFADAQRLKARTVRSRHTVVIGGGLLGLEAARAMRQFNTRVTVVERAPRLMFRQLDSDGAAWLQRHVEKSGIEVITDARVERLIGKDQVEGVLLDGDRLLPCDTVIVAAGIAPNADLARQCGLNVARGVMVNDHLRTNDPAIFAVGECAEHRDTLYGLVNPGYEQAAIVAHVIAGNEASYSGSMAVARLKVVGCTVFSVGEVETERLRRQVTFQDTERGIFRRIFLNGTRIEAALAIGHWSDATRIQEAVASRRRLWPWQLVRFRVLGSLWSEDTANVSGWPATATVCNCMGITRGSLSQAVERGCRNVACLAEQTGASTVCGSCRPLLMQLAGATELEPVRAARALTLGAVAAGVAALVFVMMPAIPYNESVQEPLQWDRLWRDGLLKQLSGFVLLGLAAVLGVVSIPKRVRRIRLGDFALWRAFHVLIGVIAVLALVGHTGMRTGNFLNFWLMASFLGALLAGVSLSAAVGLQHRFPVAVARRLRASSLWLHIALLWPLPALLGFHVLKTYWF